MERIQNCHKYDIPIWHRYILTVQEASGYFHIGEKKIRDLIKAQPNSDFILWNGNRPMIKRKLFEAYIDSALFRI